MTGFLLASADSDEGYFADDCTVDDCTVEESLPSKLPFDCAIEEDVDACDPDAFGTLLVAEESGY